MIIGLGGQMTVGKTYAAEHIEKHTNEPHVKAFADEVKRIAKHEFGWDGVKDEAGRRLLQVIGTEAGRAYNPNIWIEHMEDWYYSWFNPLNLRTLIIPDCRFPNEVEWVRANDGIAILIQSPHVESNGIINHASETEMYKANWTAQLVNNKDEHFLEDLKNTLIMFGVEWIN